MPLPKIPSKPAALLSPKEYPKAEKGKIVKPVMTTPEPVAQKPASKKPAPVEIAMPPAARKKTTEIALVETHRLAKNPAVEERMKSSTSRAADKVGATKLFVLDTNVLMHDPSSLFRFEEHDVYLPMMTLEELDDHKKGMSEVARNARQVSRSLDALVGDIENHRIEQGIPLSKLGNKDAKGYLYFQTKLHDVSLPEGLPVGKADNQILGVVRALEVEQSGRAVVLVSKDINMRIKARALGLP